MYRVLIALAIVAGLCALGAVGLAIHKSMTSHQPAVVAPSDAPAVASESANKPARPVRPRIERTTPVVAATDSAVTAASPGSASSALAETEDNLLKAHQRINFRLKVLQEWRYQLSITNKFERLGSADPKLSLTDVQKAQLNVVTDNLKPQLEAAFRETWAKQDQLFLQMVDPEADPGRDRGPLLQQYDALNEAMRPQQELFNQQVLATMTPCLSADQVQALKAMPPDNAGRGYRRGFTLHDFRP